MTLVTLGDVLQARAMGATSDAIRMLLKLAPANAWKLDEHGNETQIALGDVRVGDRG